MWPMWPYTGSTGSLEGRWGWPGTSCAPPLGRRCGCGLCWLGGPELGAEILRGASGEVSLEPGHAPRGDTWVSAVTGP